MNNQYTVQDIHNGPIEPLVFPVWIFVEMCYYTFHITLIQCLGVFPCLFYFYKVRSSTTWNFGTITGVSIPILRVDYALRLLRSSKFIGVCPTSHWNNGGLTYLQLRQTFPLIVLTIPIYGLGMRFYVISW